jgi:hypothetical protein
MIALNSKNSYGAYTGVTVYNVTFDGGEVVGLSEMRGLDGLLTPSQNGDLMARTRAMAASCGPVSDVEIQRLLQGEIPAP